MNGAQVDVALYWKEGATDKIWEQAMPLLAPAVERSHGMYSVDVIRQCVATGQMQLWFLEQAGTVTALAVTEIVRFATGIQVLMVPIVTGEDIDQILSFAPKLETVARNLNCQWVRSWARDGWVKKLKPLGWTSDHRLVEKDLRQ